MKNKALGRPSKDNLILSKDVILKEALHILDTYGEKKLSFRKLALKFDVTAMALKHHVGTRHDLLMGLVEIVYTDLDISPEMINSKETIRQLLGAYCKKVLEHPNLTTLLLTDHSLINDQLIKLTTLIKNQVILLTHTNEEGALLTDVIIDYTHGFAIAAASQNKKTTMGSLAIGDFHKGLDWILGRI